MVSRIAHKTFMSRYKMLNNDGIEIAVEIAALCSKKRVFMQFRRAARSAEKTHKEGVR
jgi:hypothetical protein